MADEPAEPNAMDDASPAARLTELEVRSEFHARTVEELDQVVREFTERLERLEREVEELKAALLASVAARDHESSGPYSTT